MVNTIGTLRRVQRGWTWCRKCGPTFMLRNGWLRSHEDPDRHESSIQHSCLHFIVLIVHNTHRATLPGHAVDVAQLPCGGLASDTSVSVPPIIYFAPPERLRQHDSAPSHHHYVCKYLDFVIGARRDPSSTSTSLQRNFTGQLAARSSYEPSGNS